MGLVLGRLAFVASIRRNISMTKKQRVPFTEVNAHFEKCGWKLLLYFKKWRIFVKPKEPDEPPRAVRLQDSGEVDQSEFDRLKP